MLQSGQSFINIELISLNVDFNGISVHIHYPMYMNLNSGCFFGEDSTSNSSPLLKLQSHMSPKKGTKIEMGTFA